MGAELSLPSCKECLGAGSETLPAPGSRLVTSEQNQRNHSLPRRLAGVGGVQGLGSLLVKGESVGI